MTRPLSLRAHLMIGAGCLMIGLFGASTILWHITLGHREPPSLFFALLSHAHLFAVVCLICMAIGVAQVQRGWRSIDQVRGHLADIHDKPERRLTGRYPAEIAPLAADVNRLLDQRDAMVARASLAAGDLAHGLKTPLAILTQDGERARRDGHTDLAASISGAGGSHAPSGGHPSGAGATRCVPSSAGCRGVVAGIDRRASCGPWSGSTASAGSRSTCALPKASKCWRRERISTRFSATSSTTRASGRARRAGSRPVPRPAASSIVIDDDGPGIPAEVRERVPGRGVRADEAAPGSGLGLSIAHDLAQAYGGRTSLEESPLGGLRVVIELQAPRSDLQSTHG